MTKAYQLWDWPTRVFHWMVVACIPLAWWTGEEGQFDWHQWIGYTVIVLVVFRVIWGLVGSRHSRFADFVRGPGAVAAYLKGKIPAGAGHNPLGGWSVLLLLLLLLVQGVSGLFNSDDILFDGPLRHIASVQFRDTMGVIHENVFNILLGFIGLHVVAVAWYQWGRKQKLIQAMVLGRAPGREGEAGPAPVWLAVLIVAVVAGLFWLLLDQIPRPVSPW